jgi:hypothetical protein
VKVKWGRSGEDGGEEVGEVEERWKSREEVA